MDISPLSIAIRKGHFVFVGKRLSDILTLDISVVYLICQFNKAFEQILKAHAVVAVCRFFSDVPSELVLLHHSDHVHILPCSLQLSFHDKALVS